MRLTSTEIRTIKNQAARHFGPQVRVWLFGSRVDDAQRGGDIDLLVEANLPDAAAALAAEIRFRVDLQREIGEQKIDVLLDYPARKVRPSVVEIARQTGVLL